MLRCPVSLLVLAPLAPAQSLLYDAGDAGCPPVAPHPAEQSWTEVVVTGTATAHPVSPDPDWPINAWQIDDPGAGSIEYRRIEFFESVFTVTVELRPLAGSLYLGIDGGDLIVSNIWELELELSGTDLLIHRPWNPALVCMGAGDGAYHELRFEGDQGSGPMDCFYDGTYLGDIGNTAIGLVWPGSGLRWGTIDSKSGRARFHRVELRGPVWGPRGNAYCGPAVLNSGGLSARIAAQGNLGETRLFALNLPVNEFGYFLVSETQGFVQPLGSAGNLCLGGNIGRFAHQVRNSGSGGTFWMDVANHDVPTNPPDHIFWGDTWNFQAWFRDGATSNFTDGVSIVYM